MSFERASDLVSAGFEPLLLLPQLPYCYNYRPTPPHPAVTFSLIFFSDAGHQIEDLAHARQVLCH